MRDLAVLIHVLTSRVNWLAVFTAVSLFLTIVYVVWSNVSEARRRR